MEKNLKIKLKKNKKKRQRNQRSNYQHPLDHRKGKRLQKKNSTFASLTMLKPLTVWVTTNCGKFLKRWKSRPPYLPPENSVCKSRRNSQNQAQNKGMVPNWDRARQGYILSPCVFNLYAKYIMRNAGLEEAQAGIKIARYADDTTLMTPPFTLMVKRN